jgi:acetoin:2,6-dichlorophenolindophenol oxidoreductase subunit beta
LMGFTMSNPIKFSAALRLAQDDLLKSDELFTILGQGVWSPFYVGSTLDGLEKEFGRHRVIDTPVAENAVTAAALGAAIMGNPTLVIHPRMDFMILASDPLVNSAAKWRYSLNFQTPIPLTIRVIINRGGEQGAQHSQALQSWYSHVPGLRVVMPSSPSDAYRLLVQSVKSPDPVLFIEDRWSYDSEESFEAKISFPPLAEEGPKTILEGSQITLVGSGYTTDVAKKVAFRLKSLGISTEVIDLRVLNPLNPRAILESVNKTGNLIVIDGGWKQFGIGAEIIATLSEAGAKFKSPPRRFSIAGSPAPTSKVLESSYYLDEDEILEAAVQSVGKRN